MFACGLGLGFSTVTAVAVTGCTGPYTGKPERLEKPRKKKRPQAEEDGALALDDECRTNFFAKPTKRRNQRQGRALASQAERILSQAEGQEGQPRILSVQEALSKLSNALRADPYGPAPTYRMAVAYALVGKKGCSLALLDRLQQLTVMPEVQGEAERTVNRALRDQTFDIFRKEADAAMGR